MKPMTPPKSREVIAGNVYDKHATTNPIERRLVRQFLRQVDELVAQTGAASIHEVGCGEGHLARRLARQGYEVRGTDQSAAIIETARCLAKREEVVVPFTAVDVLSLKRDLHSAPLVVCSEVLEHVEDPHTVLAKISQLASPWALLSVPQEPLWRVLNLARGKYVPSLGNTPGHLQHWSRSGFLRLVRQHFDICEVRSPLPWTIALCQSRST